MKKKTIQITESQINEVSDAVKLTEYKFYNNVQRFLSDILKDPVGAKVPFLLQANGIDRNKLLYHLKSNGIVNRHQKISDTDSQGNPKTAKMIIKYGVPKKDFAKKMKKLFIALVAKNVPEKIERMLNEDGEGGGAAMGGATNCDSSGQYSQPLFGVQRRKMPTEIEETTATTNVGNYQYTVPFGGDKETLARKNGKGGSVSVNTVDEEIDEAKVRKNDKGDKIPDKCPKCGSKIGVYIKGEPVYLCSNKKCGKYFGTVPFED